MKAIKVMSLFLLRLVGALLVVCLCLILTQELQIFPSIVNGLMTKKGVRHESLPPGVTSHFVKTEDGKVIESLRMAAKGTDLGRVAVFFHGNAGTVDNFLFIQEWLSGQGITSYGFDYRGYGRSSGWPSEHGIYADGDAVINFALEKEGKSAKELILVGLSIGSGPSAVLAKRYNPELLILLSPYTDLRSLTKRLPVFGFLAPFLWYTFPTKDSVSALTRTSLIVAHGKKDEVIPFDLGEEVFNAYRGAGEKIFIQHDTSDHNGIFWLTEVQLSKALHSVLSLGSTKNNP